MLEAAQKPLHGQTKVSQLDGIGCLMALKSQFSLSRDAFDSLLTIFGSMLPEDHILPKSMYQAQKILDALKMPYEQIHSCPNVCILFRKEHEAETYCPKCKASRFLEVDAGDGQPKRRYLIANSLVDTASTPSLTKLRARTTDSTPPIRPRPETSIASVQQRHVSSDLVVVL